MCITFFCMDPFMAKTLPNVANGTNQELNKHIKKQDQAASECKERKNKRIKKLKVQLKDKAKNRKTEQSQCEQNEPIDQHASTIKFMIAFNRDQKSQRRTLKLGPFEDDPNIYAGRDLKSTGTWLGVNIKTGIMVILTNYDLPDFRPGKSRGQLVNSFLKTDFISQENINDHNVINKKIENSLREILVQCVDKKYAAFNLLVFNIRNDSIYYICSELQMKQAERLEKGQVYGLCNSDLRTMWPKTKHGIQLFQRVIQQSINKNDEQILNQLSKMMKDTKQFSKNPNDQASIFIQPFYSTIQNAQRMTKSTFIAIIKENKREQGGTFKKQLQLIMRQITYKYISSVQTSGINKNYEKYSKQIEYDHINEAIVEYRLKL